MAAFLDRLLTACASLRLAVGVIVALAVYLAAATVYEARYGVRAAQLVIYQSPAFAGVLGLLALNVMAAAVVRIPWKRHQTGFVVTHLGIEVLLLGCLVGAVWGVDGRMILTPGDRTDTIDLPAEHAAAWPAGESADAATLFPLRDARMAAYPSFSRFLLLDLWTGETTAGLSAPRKLGESSGVTWRAVDWRPAVRVERRYEATPASGMPAARVRVSGRTPDGAALDRTVWFGADEPAELFDGVLRFRFRTAPNDTASPRAPAFRGELLLAPDGDGWRATARGPVRTIGSVPAKPGQSIEAWMGLRVTVEEMLESAARADEVIPLRVPAAEVDTAVAAVKVRAEASGGAVDRWLLRGDRPVRIDLPGAAPVEAAYAFESARLPFEVELIDARRDGPADMPASMTATVRTRAADADGVTGDAAMHTIAPNRPAQVGGRTVYLSAVEGVAGRDVAFLSVRHDPGGPIKYAGSTLIVLGTVMMFVFKKPRAVPAESCERAEAAVAVAPMAGVKVAALLVVVAGVLGLTRPAGATTADWSPIRAVPVEHAGRVKPLETMAREVVRSIQGREGNDPLTMLMGWATDPAGAEQTARLSVPNLELRAKLGLPAGEKAVAPGALRGAAWFVTAADEVSRRQRTAEEHGETPGFSRMESATLELKRRLDLFDAVTAGHLFAVVPPISPGASWRTPEQAPMHPAAGWWREVLRSGSTGAVPPAPPDGAWGESADADRLAREVAYHRLHPFRAAGAAYAIGLVLLLIHQARPRAGRAWLRAAFAVVALGVLLHAAAFAWRCSVTGWAPVTNMYETVVWVGGVAAVLGLTLAWSAGAPIAAVAGTVVAALACVVGDVMPPALGRSIATLPPVLQSNLWLTVHVLTVVSSYAAFALATVLANVALWKLGASPSRPPLHAMDAPEGHDSTPSTRGNRTSDIPTLIYRCIQVGVVLIAAGTVLGALWADVSWGRFWGWDPKEVWALIVLLAYLALLHARSAGYVREFGLCAGAVVCFLTVLMSWYGVNFVLGAGLHSYGFGAGGAGYVMGYVFAQVGFVIWAAWRYRIRASPEPAAGRGPAGAGIAPGPAAVSADAGRRG